MTDIAKNRPAGRIAALSLPLFKKAEAKKESLCKDCKVEIEEHRIRCEECERWEAF